MEILGVILWFMMPAVAGYTVCNILRWKETNQIETYLIGFFFLFFAQGIIFVPAVFAHLSYQMAVMGVMTMSALLAVLATIFFILNQKKKQLKNTETSHISHTKREKVYMIMAVSISIINIIRMVLTNGVLREDMTLETVKTTVETQTMFRYHPLTGSLMDAGMIGSKKLVTVPLFYSSFVSVTGIDAQIFLNVIVGAMVLLASMFAASLAYTRVASVNKKKLYLFWLIYGLMVLSGDYHSATLSYRILHQGYQGETICYAVILPYLLYVIISWYQMASSDTKTMFANHLRYILKLLLPLGTAFVIAGVGTGCALLVACLFVAAASCLIKSVKEVRTCKE